MCVLNVRRFKVFVLDPCDAETVWGDWVCTSEQMTYKGIYLRSCVMIQANRYHCFSKHFMHNYEVYDIGYFCLLKMEAGNCQCLGEFTT